MTRRVQVKAVCQWQNGQWVKGMVCLFVVLFVVYPLLMLWALHQCS